MKNKKIICSGMLVALAVTLSGFSIPISASRCFPVQHLINVLAGVYLGPFYGILIAFCTSLIRNLMGTGSLLAFPGSMVGAFLSAYLFQRTEKFVLAYLGEIIGTGLLGATLSYPVAVFLMGKEVAVFFFVLPFLMSTVTGTVLAMILMEIMRRSGLFSYVRGLVHE